MRPASQAGRRRFESDRPLFNDKRLPVTAVARRRLSCAVPKRYGPFSPMSWRSASMAILPPHASPRLPRPASRASARTSARDHVQAFVQGFALRACAFSLRKPSATGYIQPAICGRKIMNRCILLSSILILAAGCDQGGVTDVDIRVDNGFLTPAMAIEVAPDVPVSKNEFRSWDRGFRGKQRLEISGDPTATLILVPSGRAYGVIVPDTIIYVGQRAGTTTAIEINRRSWQYRRIDLEDEPTDIEDDAILARLETSPWVSMGNYRFVAFQSLLWAWASSPTTEPSRPPYRRPSDGSTDRLVFAPHGTFGTIGDAASPKPPPEWNALIHALREFCPPHDASLQTDTQPGAQ